jgi:hypothetical protein
MEKYTQHIIVHGDGITLDLMVKPETDLTTPSRHGIAMQRNTSWSPDGWSMRSKTHDALDAPLRGRIDGTMPRTTDSQMEDTRCQSSLSPTKLST